MTTASRQGWRLKAAILVIHAVAPNTIAEQAAGDLIEESAAYSDPWWPLLQAATSAPAWLGQRFTPLRILSAAAIALTVIFLFQSLHAFVLRQVPLRASQAPGTGWAITALLSALLLAAAVLAAPSNTESKDTH